MSRIGPKIQLPLLVALSLSLVVSTSCSSHKPSDFFIEAIADVGALPVSPTNPYLAGNLFVGKAAEESATFHAFLRRRGAPHAIEAGPKGESRTTVALYYGDHLEYYLADRHQSLEFSASTGRSGGWWVIRGPMPLQRSHYLSIRGLIQVGQPVLLIRGEEVRFSPKDDLPDQKPRPTLTPTPPPHITPLTNKPKQKPIVRRAPQPIAEATPNPAPTPTPPLIPKGPLNSDQRALLHSQGLIPPENDGSLIHEVKSEGEKLTELVKWYTEDEANTSAIAKENQIEDSSPLKVGNRIKIPAPMVKNSKKFMSPAKPQVVTAKPQVGTAKPKRASHR